MKRNAVKGTVVQVKHLRFASFVKFTMLLWLAMGVIAGLLLFCAALLGGEVDATVNGRKFDGMTAGVIGMFVSPFIALVCGALLGVIGYIPCLAVLRISGGIQWRGRFEVEPEDAISIQESPDIAQGAHQHGVN